MNAVVLESRQPDTLPLQQSAGASEMQALISVMQQAIGNPDIPVERMEKLVNIALDATERMDANRAKKAYAAAMAEFKRNPPRIVKDAHVKYTTSKGVTEYDHATLGALCQAVIAGLAEVGISHEWKLGKVDKEIQVTCILTHAFGHKEQFPSIPAPPDDSGGKNAIQAIQSTVTYLERSTLFAGTGLAALAPPDNDGRGSGEPGKLQELTISEQQVMDLLALITEHKGNLPKLLRYLKVESLQDIAAKNYAWVIAEVKRLAVVRAEAPTK